MAKKRKKANGYNLNSQDIKAAPNNDEDMVEKNSQEESKILIDILWKQCEVLSIKTPEFYLSRIKISLWISSIVIGLLAQVLIIFTPEPLLRPRDIEDVFFLIFFIAIIGLSAFSILYGVKHIHKIEQVGNTLNDTLDFLCDVDLKKHSISKHIITQLNSYRKDLENKKIILYEKIWKLEVLAMLSLLYTIAFFFIEFPQYIKRSLP